MLPTYLSIVLIGVEGVTLHRTIGTNGLYRTPNPNPIVRYSVSSIARCIVKCVEVNFVVLRPFVTSIYDSPSIINRHQNSL